MVSQSPAFEGRSLFGLNAETRGERVLQKEVLFVQSQSPSGKKVSQNFLPSWGWLKLHSAGCVSRRLFKKRESLQEKGKLIRTVDGFEIMSDRENEEDSSCK